jgi:hypothetical protein
MLNLSSFLFCLHQFKKKRKRLGYVCITLYHKQVEHYLWQVKHDDWLIHKFIVS